MRVKRHTHPLSLKMPALLIRMVTPPNVSKAVLITAAPSVTDDVFATAFPPAFRADQKHMCPEQQVRRTLYDLIHDFLCSIRADIVHDDVGSPFRKQV